MPTTELAPLCIYVYNLSGRIQCNVVVRTLNSDWLIKNGQIGLSKVQLPSTKLLGDEYSICVIYVLY